MVELAEGALGRPISASHNVPACLGPSPHLELAPANAHTHGISRVHPEFLLLVVILQGLLLFLDGLPSGFLGHFLVLNLLEKDLFVAGLLTWGSLTKLQNAGVIFDVLISENALFVTV